MVKVRMFTGQEREIPIIKAVEWAERELGNVEKRIQKIEEERKKLRDLKAYRRYLMNLLGRKRKYTKRKEIIDTQEQVQKVEQILTDQGTEQKFEQNL